MFDLLTGQRMDLLGRAVRLIVREVALHAGDNRFGHEIHPPLGVPPVGAGDILICAGEADHGGDLGIEGVGVLIPHTGVAQVPIGPVVVIKDADPAGVGEVAGGAGGDQILFAAPLKISGGFPGLGGQKAVVMDGVFLRNLGIIVAQRGTDQLEMGPLEPDIGLFRTLVHMEAEVAGVHFETGADPEIRRLLHRIYEEYYADEPYSSALMNALMTTFFILLLRRYEGTVRLPRTEDFYWKHQFSAILSHIQTHYAEVTLADLAARFHYSEKQISRIVRDRIGISYNQLILKLRMEKAATLLRQRNISVEAVATAVGYSTVSSFYRAFTKYFGCTPGSYLAAAKE